MLKRAMWLMCAGAWACGGSNGGTGLVAVPVGTSPVRGPSDAWVTMVEFGDFECPYCGAEEPIVESLLQQYPADLRLVFKNFPLTSLHPDAQAAAIAAECANAQGLFWPMHDNLYANQSELDTAGLQNDAVDAGVDLSTWQACLPSQPPQNAINADVALGYGVGVQGTPTFYINGQMVLGAVPESQLQSVITSALASAEDSGVPQASYYDVVVLGEDAGS
jgi:protein-disulfide isomerase